MLQATHLVPPFGMKWSTYVRTWDCTVDKGSCRYSTYAHVYVYVYVCICMYMYVCMYMYTCYV